MGKYGNAEPNITFYCFNDEETTLSLYQNNSYIVITFASMK